MTVLDVTRTILVSTLCIVFVAATGCRQRQPLRIGDAVEGIVLEDIFGHTVAVPEGFAGKAIVLRFWSVECPSCSKELIKAFEGLYRKYKDQGLALVTVNVHKTSHTLEAFRKLDGVTYSLLIDPNSKVAQRFGVTGLPTTFILDRNGVIREKIVGDMELNEFEKLVIKVLGEGDSNDTVH